MINHKELLPIRMSKNGFTCFYYFRYYPTRYEVEEKYQEYRKIVWNFKDGLYNYDFHKSIADDFNFLNLPQPKTDWWICAIPASTEEKTITRFKRFCEVYAYEAGINNGYSLLFNQNDREAVHLQENRGNVNLMECIGFREIFGKKILLFDDIYTTGKSFLRVARELKAKGATHIVGLFLGKTHWLDNENKENVIFTL